MFELSKTITKDKIYLHGIFKKGDKQKLVVLYIHGFESDFYSETFIPIVSDSLKDNGYSFLSGETRGTGLQTLFQKSDGNSYICGSQLELLKDAYMDIDAWVEFLIEKGYKNIVLLGHSLGGQKIVRYMAEGEHTKYIRKIILISPSDIHGFVDIISQGKYKNIMNEAKNKISENHGNELIKQDFFGINMSYQTYVSWFTSDHFGKMFNFADKDNNFMLLNKINIPLYVIVGEKDEFFYPTNPSNLQEAIDILKLNVKNFDSEIIPDCNHNFQNKEHELAQSIIKFLDK